jgi:hypothetical protein
MKTLNLRRTLFLALGVLVAVMILLTMFLPLPGILL